jgi:hypothetical protein
MTHVALDMQVLRAIVHAFDDQHPAIGSAAIYRQLTSSGAPLSRADFDRSLTRLHVSGAIQVSATATETRGVLGDYFIYGVDSAVARALRGRRHTAVPDCV